MRPLKALLAMCVMAAALGGPLAGLAAAAAPSPLADCSATGRLTHTYTVPQLQHALATMPADVREYSNCYDVINNALLAALGGSHGGGGGSGSGGALLPTPVIVVIVLLLVAAASLGALALRRRRGAPPA